uniref:Uncharacterized protein n=1 Tax=Siphoviridae sp. ctEEM24 TaxID=2826203 RepID=A0A8S5LYN0_9CAUD|nr:MAG TPA: hypothetical protein [Siphoviridae sp. ctEEM24]
MEVSIYHVRASFERVRSPRLMPAVSSGQAVTPGRRSKYIHKEVKKR